jgi:DNA-binding MarR family transcriptional regulator
MNKLDQAIADMHQYRARSWPRLIKRLRRHIDEHATIELKKRGFHDFKLAYLPFLFNIDPQGITNTELSKRACVSKQAMSKIVSELTSHGYISTQKHTQDARSSILHLTIKGKKFVMQGKECMIELSNRYAVLLGKKNYELMIDMLLKILAYHEQPIQTSKDK